MELSKDTELTLTFGNQRAVVSPFGASLRRYYLSLPEGDWNAVWGYAGGTNKKGGQGDVLFPFPGRIKNGTYEFRGTHYELAKNDKEGPNAIHGFLRTELYSIAEQTPASARFEYQLRASDYASRGYPFSMRVSISYSLGAAGLRTQFEIQNTGESEAPVGIGFHPYFCAQQGDVNSWTAQIPAGNFIEFENLVPTGSVPTVEGTKLDFRSPRVIGSEQYNACLAHVGRDANGFAHAILRDRNLKSRVTLTLDKTFDYIVIYTGDQIPAPHTRLGFAIEPMTCAPDAFNHDDWGTKTLAPGDAFSGSYYILAELT